MAFKLVKKILFVCCLISISFILYIPLLSLKRSVNKSNSQSTDLHTVSSAVGTPEVKKEKLYKPLNVSNILKINSENLTAGTPEVKKAKLYKPLNVSNILKINEENHTAGTQKSKTDRAHNSLNITTTFKKQTKNMTSGSKVESKKFNQTTLSPPKNVSATFRPYVCNTKFASRRILVIVNETYDKAAIRRHPNLEPFLLFSESYSSSIPEIPSIRWTGTVYQESWEELPKFLLYSAHFDTRLSSGLSVRILGLYDGKEEPNKTDIFCQMWYNKDENPIIAAVHNVALIFYGGWTGFKNRLYGITCKVPVFKNETRDPIAVSVVKQNCQQPTNFLKILGSTMKKFSIPKDQIYRQNLSVGVCGKALFYYNVDASLRLIEWIEIMRALGASQVFLYKMPCHKNITKVLEYYEKTGFVKLINFYYPPPYVQEGTFVRLWTGGKLVQWWNAQSIYINDCLLRYKDHFDYLLVYDPDEVPVLKQHKTLQELIKFVLNVTGKRIIGSINLQLKDFYGELKPGKLGEQIPKKYYNLHHTRRGKLTTKSTGLEQNVKTIYDTNYLIWAGCHSAFLHESDPGIHVEGEFLQRFVAYTGHWGGRVCSLDFCNESVLEEEDALLKHKDEIMRNVDLASKHVYGN